MKEWGDVLTNADFSRLISADIRRGGITILLCLTFLLVSCLAANTFLTGLVENVGDGTKTVGEVWTGYTNYKDFVRTQTLTVNKQSSETYIDYPIEIISNFDNQYQTPIWTGMFSGGVYTEYKGYGIKVISINSDGTQTELPFQISKDTRCFDSTGDPTAICSDSGGKYHVSYLRITALKNITSSAESIQIMYSFSFNSTNSPIPDNYYRFVLNATSGNYYAYTNSPYAPRIFYNHNTGNVAVPELPASYVRTNGDISELQLGTCTMTYPTGNSISYVKDLLKCPNTPLVGNWFTNIMGITNPSVDFNVSVMLEIEKTSCNLAGIGYGNANMIEEIYPGFIRQKASVTPLYGTGTTSTYIYNPRTSASGCGLGMGGSFFISDYAKYRNTTVNDINFPNSASYVTAINPLYAGTGASHTGESVFGMMGCGAAGFAPVAYVLNNRTSSMNHIINSYGRTYTYGSGGGCGVAGDSIINTTSTLSGNDRFEVFTIPYIKSLAYGLTSCSLTKGYATYNIPISIFTSEPFGGKMSLYAPASGYSTPCEHNAYNYCYELVDDPITGYHTISGTNGRINVQCDIQGKNLGFYDNCNNFIPCRYCDYCTQDWKGLHCGTTCYGYWLNQTCINGNKYGSYSCTAVSPSSPVQFVEDCQGAGCSVGMCRSRDANSDITFSATSHLGDSQITGVNVTVSGYDSTSQIYTTSCAMIPNACTLSLAPGRWNFTGSLTGYLTGAENCIGNQITQNGYANGCTFTVPNNNDQSVAFSMLLIGENENTTAVTINTQFRGKPIPSVSVNLPDYSKTQITDNNGITTFIINVTNPTLYIISNKTGYATSDTNRTITRGRKQTLTILLDKQQDIIVSQGQDTTGRLIDYTILTPSQLTLTIKENKPGRVLFSRDDVIVHPCNDYLCTEYKLQGLNSQWVLGPNEQTGYIFKDCVLSGDPYGYNASIWELATDKVKPIFLTSGSLTAIPVEEYRNIRTMGKCDNYLYSAPYIPYSGFNYSTEYIAGGLQIERCVYQGITYCPIYSSEAPADTTSWTSFLDRIQSKDSPVHLNMPGGLKVVTLFCQTISEFFGTRNKQDITIDYLIFNLNYDTLRNIIFDNNETQVIVHGAMLTGKPNDILRNPTYSPLVGRGYDPAVLDSGILSVNTRGDNRDSPSDSYGLPQGGLEKQDWSTPLIQGYVYLENDGSYTYKLKYPLTQLIQDVIKDIENGRYYTSDIEFFDLKNPVKRTESGKTSADNFRIQTYIKIDFVPADTSLPTETEYIRVDIPYRKNSIMIWGYMILGFAFIIFVMATLSRFYIRVGKTSRGRRK